jgi:hypothetical protein
MDSTEPVPNHQPVRRTVESDPAYDFAEDVPVEEWDVDDDALDEEERVVPLDTDDEFREPDFEED